MDMNTPLHLRDRDDIVLRVEHLTVEYSLGKNRKLQAVSDVSFDLAKGEVLGLVGESGCGKSTTGRALMQITRPTSGTVQFGDVNLAELSEKELRNYRTQMQMIFQDPISSLNPRRSIRDIVAEGIAIWEGREALNSDRTQERLATIFEAVGLDLELVGRRRRHQFSGGQCQRICIARALIMEPEVLICDEPVSALDVSVQAQILNLLEEMKSRFSLTMVFIAHDLAVVKNVSDRVAVMYLGKICEIGPSEGLYAKPLHPYTNLLMASIPEIGLEGRSSAIEWETQVGEPPSPVNPPSGCRFRTRCPRAETVCAEQEPLLRSIGESGDHWVACHFPVV
jgi:peptide/nickel transport system ATP-binding protein